MKKMILMSMIILGGFAAHAAGRQEASAVCSSFKFESDRTACFAEIGKHSYYEQSALNICKTFNFSDSKLECVKAIGDKSYDQYETDNCSRSSFDSDKLECLTSNGRPAFPTPPPPSYPGCLSNNEVVMQLRSIDRLVYGNRNNDARIAINDLMNRLQRCP